MSNSASLPFLSYIRNQDIFLRKLRNEELLHVILIKKRRFVVTLTNIKTAVYIHQTEQFFLGNCVKVAKIVCPYMAFLKRRSFSKESTSTSTGRKSTTAETALHKVQPS